MQAPIACVTRACGSFGRLRGSEPSAWFWAWSWDPLKFARRHPPHHLSPAWADYPAGPDPEARLSRPSHHSNAPIKPESQSIVSKIVAHFLSSRTAKTVLDRKEAVSVGILPPIFHVPRSLPT